MLTREDVENFMLRAELDYEQIGDEMWAIGTSYEGARIVIHHSPPVLVFRLKVLDLPDDEKTCTTLFRRLLELNATELVHGAYGLEEDSVVLADTLEMENLDFNEFQATVDSFQMALASHLEDLAPFRTC